MMQRILRRPLFRFPTITHRVFSTTTSNNSTVPNSYLTETSPEQVAKEWEAQWLGLAENKRPLSQQLYDALRRSSIQNAKELSSLDEDSGAVSNEPLPDFNIPNVLPVKYPQFAIGRRKTAEAFVLMVPSDPKYLKKISQFDPEFVDEGLKGHLIRNENILRAITELSKENDPTKDLSLQFDNEANDSIDNETVVWVNERSCADFFKKSEYWQQSVFAPLVLCNASQNVKIFCRVHGGGETGKAEAIQLGIARALLMTEPLLKKALKQHKFLTRDSRMVERKKPGQKKARKKFTWVKR